jgi:acyl dehydratase
VFWGDTVTADPEEMLDYARRNDPLPFHLDENAAKASLFGGLIASGEYTVTLWYRSLIPIVTKLAFLAGFDWLIKMPAPVRPNDRLRVKVEIKNKRASSKPGRGYVTVFEEMFNQDDTVVFSCELTWMLATRQWITSFFFRPIALRSLTSVI